MTMMEEGPRVDMHGMGQHIMGVLFFIHIFLYTTRPHHRSKALLSMSSTVPRTSFSFFFALFLVLLGGGGHVRCKYESKAEDLATETCR